MRPRTRASRHGSWRRRTALPVLFLLTMGCGTGTWDGGIHARMRWSEGQGLEVVEVPRGPARRAGLDVGERIVAIDGEALDGQRLDDVLALLRGPVGSDITLTVTRGTRQRTLVVRRAPYRD